MYGSMILMHFLLCIVANICALQFWSTFRNLEFPVLQLSLAHRSLSNCIPFVVVSDKAGATNATTCKYVLCADAGDCHAGCDGSAARVCFSFGLRNMHFVYRSVVRVTATTHHAMCAKIHAQQARYVGRKVVTPFVRKTILQQRMFALVFCDRCVFVLKLPV